MIRISEGELFRIPLKLLLFRGTVVLSVWSFLRSFAVIRSVSAGKLTGKRALMPECGPPSSWRRRPECECYTEIQAGHPDSVAGRQRHWV